LKKTMLWLVLAFCFLLGNTVTAETLSQTTNVSMAPITFYFDGKPDTTSKDSGYFFNGRSSIPKGIIYQGTTYVPLRYFSEKLNVEVGWEPVTRSIWLGKRPLNLSPAFSQTTTRILASIGNATIQADIVPYSFYFDGQSTANAPKGLSYEWSTYVPLRYLSEQLKKEVGWDPTSRSIWVGTKPTIFNPPQGVNAHGIYGVYIGQASSEVQNLLGTPKRMDPSPFGYEWWIYNQDLTRYVQVGIKDGKVVDLYSNAPTWTFQTIKIGTEKSQVNQILPYQSEVSFSYDQANFSITNDQAERPLYLFEGNPVIIYLDKYKQETVTGIRFIAKQYLFESRSYALNATYYGQSPNFAPPAFTAEEQKQIEQGSERQILDLTNVARLRNGLPSLTWNETAAEVGRSHSVDMSTHHFFDHVSATSGLDPFQRMEKAGITFVAAGENIAEGYSDAVEVYEGWMNSLGHRENILNEHFTTLGVGVYQTDYAQEFVTP
jgi:uncharacterized protein YkwD